MKSQNKNNTCKIQTGDDLLATSDRFSFSTYAPLFGRALDNRIIQKFAPFVFLLIALPSVVFLSYGTPPFQGVDEPSHVFRAVQLLGGGIVGKRTAFDAGGAIETNVFEASRVLAYSHGLSDQRIDPETMRIIRAFRWDARKTSYVAFSNTVLYPPFFYIPAMMGIGIGRFFDLTIVDSLYLGRLIGALVSVVVSAIAIFLAKRSRALLFALLLLPMPLFLFATVTQDGLMIAVTALTIALCARAYEQWRDLTWAESALVGVMLGAIIAARPPNFLLITLLLIRPNSCLARIRFRTLAPMVLALAIAGAWIGFGAAPAKIPFRLEADVSMVEQIGFLFENPLFIFKVVANTIVVWGGWHYAQFIGALGWHDVYLPDLYYLSASVALVIAALVGGFASGRALSVTGACYLLAASLLTCGIIYVAQYLSWTKVGANLVDGIQGRYFLPPALLLSFALPGFFAAKNFFPDSTIGRGGRIESVGWLLLFAFFWISTLYFPGVVLSRYHG